MENTIPTERDDFAPATVPAASGTGETKRRPGKLDVPLLERAMFTLREFAALHGRHECWAYRLYYARKLRVSTISGQLMVPRAELERLQREAATIADNPRARRPRGRHAKRGAAPSQPLTSIDPVN